MFIYQQSKITMKTLIDRARVQSHIFWEKINLNFNLNSVQSRLLKVKVKVKSKSKFTRLDKTKKTLKNLQVSTSNYSKEAQPDSILQANTPAQPAKINLLQIYSSLWKFQVY